MVLIALLLESVSKDSLALLRQCWQIPCTYIRPAVKGWQQHTSSRIQFNAEKHILRLKQQTWGQGLKGGLVRDAVAADVTILVLDSHKGIVDVHSVKGLLLEVAQLQRALAQYSQAIPARLLQTGHLL